MSRLPLRVRLTLFFALAMAVVLAGVGAFVYVRLERALTEQIDESLAARASLVALAVEGGDLARLEGARAHDDEGFVQVLANDGTVVLGPQMRPTGMRTYELVLRRRTVVVGASLDDRDEALDSLLAQLVVGGPIALLLASLAGYLLAGAALRPVELMRRRAEEISADTAGRRLPLPRAHDELLRLGQTLNAMLERLEAGVVRERQFVADASHELRTPLALLRTELELALRRPRTSNELEAALRSASEEAERLAQLAEDLLVLASASEDGLKIQPTRIEARGLLETVARRFSGDGRAIEIVANTDTITGDRLRLEQALGNLVDNALRHGGGAIRLEATGDSLRVSDQGAGFPPDFLPRAFERFSRADEARTGAGAGLGLALVEAVARAHGGTVSASNLAGGGAEATITLPPHRPLMDES